jgi:hypothetical protein
MANETETEVRRIDAAIRECGFCLMKEEQLKLLFPGGDNSQRFLLLATLAQEREWSFEFQPHNGDLRFAQLSTIRTP